MVRPINPGAYRFPARLFSARVQDDFGGGSWDDRFLRRVWVDLQQSGGSEQTENDQQVETKTYTLTTPWTPEPLDSSMFLVWNGHEYQITNVENVGERNMEYKITAIRRGECPTR